MPVSCVGRCLRVCISFFLLSFSSFSIQPSMMGLDLHRVFEGIKKTDCPYEASTWVCFVFGGLLEGEGARVERKKKEETESLVWWFACQPMVNSGICTNSVCVCVCVPLPDVDMRKPSFKSIYLGIRYHLCTIV